MWATEERNVVVVVVVAFCGVRARSVRACVRACVLASVLLFTREIWAITSDTSLGGSSFKYFSSTLLARGMSYLLRKARKTCPW